MRPVSTDAARGNDTTETGSLVERAEYDLGRMGKKEKGITEREKDRERGGGYTGSKRLNESCLLLVQIVVSTEKISIPHSLLRPTVYSSLSVGL